MWFGRTFALVFLSAFSSAILFGMDGNSRGGGKIPCAARYQIISNGNSISPLLSSSSKNEFDEDEIKEMESVFESAPEDAREILEYIENPSIFGTQGCRSSYFVGAPGTGKTTMALALAYKASKLSPPWGYKLVKSRELTVGECRNHTVKLLNQLFTGVLSESRPMLLIIDELNKLLEHSESEHYDTDTSSAALWEFLDEQKRNAKLFFIGIMNRDDKLAQPMKSRMLLKTILFKQITDPAMRLKKMHEKISNFTAVLENGGERHLATLLRTRPDASGRDFDGIALRAAQISRRTHKQDRIKMVTKRHLDQVFEAYDKEKKRTKYDQLEESTEERQERYHRESLVQTKRLNRESLAQTEELNRDSLAQAERHHREGLVQAERLNREGLVQAERLNREGLVQAERLNRESLIQQRELSLQGHLIGLTTQLNQVSTNTQVFGGSQTTHRFMTKGYAALLGFLTDDQRTLAEEMRKRSRKSEEQYERDRANMNSGCLIS